MDGLDRLAQVRRDRANARPRHQPRERYFPRPQEADSPGQGYKPGPDPRRCPNNYDPDVWNLALAFLDQAEKYDIELGASSWGTYSALFRRIRATKLRDRDNWVEIVRLMIDEFWENDVDLSGEKWAVQQFTGAKTFRNLGQWALRKLSDTPEWRDNDQSYLKDWKRATPRPEEPYGPVPDGRAYTEEEEAEVRKRARLKIAEMMKEFE